LYSGAADSTAGTALKPPTAPTVVADSFRNFRRGMAESLVGSVFIDGSFGFSGNSA
jgi:hypothetical protein